MVQLKKEETEREEGKEGRKEEWREERKEEKKGERNGGGRVFVYVCLIVAFSYFIYF